MRYELGLLSWTRKQNGIEGSLSVTGQPQGQALLGQSGSSTRQGFGYFSPWFCPLRAWFPLGAPAGCSEPACAEGAGGDQGRPHRFPLGPYPESGTGRICWNSVTRPHPSAERLGKARSSCLARVGQAREGGFTEGGGESGHRLKLAGDISHRQAQGKGGPPRGWPRAEPSPSGPLRASPGLQSWEAAGPRDRDGDSREAPAGAAADAQPARPA